MIRNAFFILFSAIGMAAQAQQFVEAGDNTGYHTRKGVTLKPGYKSVDTIFITDPVTAEERTVVRESATLPLLAGSDTIYAANSVTTAARMAGGGDLNQYFSNVVSAALRPMAKQVQPAPVSYTVYLSNIVADKRGKVVFYQFNGASCKMQDGQTRLLNAADLGQHIDVVMSNMPALAPAVKNGAPVCAYLPVSLQYTELAAGGSKAPDYGIYEPRNEGVYFMRKGYKWVPGGVLYDTILVTDPVSGKDVSVVRADTALPASVNGQRVYGRDEVAAAAVRMGMQPVEEYLAARIKEDIGGTHLNGRTTDVLVDLRNVIADATGRVVFYELGGVSVADEKGQRTYMAASTEVIEAVAHALATMPPLQPATKEGEPVMAMTPVDFSRYHFSRSGQGIVVSKQ